MVLGIELCLRDAGIRVIGTLGWPRLTLSGWCRAIFTHLLCIITAHLWVPSVLSRMNILPDKWLGRSHNGGWVGVCLESNGDACCKPGGVSPQRVILQFKKKMCLLQRENATEQPVFPKLEPLPSALLDRQGRVGVLGAECVSLCLTFKQEVLGLEQNLRHRGPYSRGNCLRCSSPFLEQAASSRDLAGWGSGDDEPPPRSAPPVPHYQG